MLTHHFAVAGIDVPLWLPPLVAFVISFFTSMGGVSGAFILLPFQMSVLGFTSPAVSPTNLVFNVVAIPGGVIRFVREGRMVWPLTWVVVIGTLPGVVVGGFIRLTYLPDPGPFKVFAGCVLLYIGARLMWDLIRTRGGAADKAPATAGEFRAETVSVGLSHIAFRFQGEVYRCSTPGIFALSLVVGVVGGIYGIGGGAIIAPFFVAIYRLPVHTVAGATLMGTFVTSVVGVGFYQLVAPWYSDAGVAAAPDWALGALFGVGGLAGIYLGARAQKFVPAHWLKLLLAAILLFVAGRYIIGYLAS